MAEDQPVKWASEAYAFFALFRRVGRRLPGLLLMELGWALLLWLVAQFSAAKDAPAAIGLPGLRAIPLADLFVPGAILWFLVWFAASGCWRLPYLAATWCLRPLASALLLAFLWLALVAFIPGFVIGEVQFRRWRRRQDPAWLAKWEPKLSGESLRELWEKNDARAVTRLIDPLLRWVGRRRRALASATRIALVPFFSYSFEEEQKAAKAPLQIFAAAIRRLHVRLADLPTVPHVHFVPMPSILRIESEDSARRLLWLLGLDTLLRGSYVSADPPRIWLNLQHRPIPRDPPDPDARDAQHPVQPRPPDDAMMLLDQDEPLDAWIVILLSYLHSLQRRRDARRQPLLRRLLTWKARDELYWSARDRTRIFASLALPILGRLDGPLSAPSLDPTPRAIFVEHASNWVVEQFRGSRFGRVEDYALLSDVMRHCVRLAPERAEHRYRLGALLCLRNDAAGALAAWREAQDLDRRAPARDRDWIGIMAGVYLDSHFGREATEDAATLAFLARALALGDAETRRNLAEKFKATSSYRFMALRASSEGGGDFSAAERLALALLGLDVHPAAQPEAVAS